MFSGLESCRKAPFLLGVMTPLPGLSPLARRRFAWATGVALAVILLFAAWTRLRWPAIPIVDPDTWGYFHPAMAKLTGHGFQHTHGRNFVYPGFVYLVLASWNDLRAIPLAQHALGLASGGLLWVCWRQWRGAFADPRLPAWADALLGLGLVAFFEQSASVVNYEHEIRPEGIFPFFALLDLSLLLAFWRAWWVERRPGRAAALAGGGIFGALLLYQLKPSFGLAVAAAAVPVLAAVGVPWRRLDRSRRMLAGAAGAAGLAAVLLFFLPEHLLSRGDWMSTLFFPETLLTVHGDIICDQMGEDVRDGAYTPFPADFLAQAHAAFVPELRIAREKINHPYPTLGFNPDYPMYNHGSYCAWLMGRLQPPQIAAFATYYYRRVWTHHPGRMLAKIGRQLGVFYSLHCPAFYPGSVLRLDKMYRKSVAAFSYPNYLDELAHYPPGERYLDAARTLGASGLLQPQPEGMIALNTAASVVAFPLLILFLAGMIAAGLARTEKFHAPAVARLLAPGWLVLLFHAFIFGNCLTISIVHSLNVDRYSVNLAAPCALALVATAAWLAEFALAFLGRSLPEP